MKYVLPVLALLTTPTLAAASDYQICNGQFALCAASSATLTGKTISVRTATGTAQFPEAVAVCPVLTGKAIADVAGGNMRGSCDAPAGKVWSLFSPVRVFPQAPDWKPVKATIRTFTTGEGTAGMSNMFSFSCTKTKTVNGVQLAECYGPINENLSGGTVPVGTTAITEAPVGSPYAVAGPVQ